MEFFKKLEASKLRSVSRKNEFKLKLDKFRVPANRRPRVCRILGANWVMFIAGIG
jgi:hypothetical protein